MKLITEDIIRNADKTSRARFRAYNKRAATINQLMQEGYTFSDKTIKDIKSIAYTARGGLRKRHTKAGARTMELYLPSKLKRRARATYTTNEYMLASGAGFVQDTFKGDIPLHISYTKEEGLIGGLARSIKKQVGEVSRKMARHMAQPDRITKPPTGRSMDALLHRLHGLIPEAVDYDYKLGVTSFQIDPKKVIAFANKGYPERKTAEIVLKQVVSQQNLSAEGMASYQIERERRVLDTRLKQFGLSDTEIIRSLLSNSLTYRKFFKEGLDSTQAETEMKAALKSVEASLHEQDDDAREAAMSLLRTAVQSNNQDAFDDAMEELLYLARK